jgi:hypothetical protein
MIGIGPGGRLGVLGPSASAYDPHFGSTIGTMACGSTRIGQHRHRSASSVHLGCRRSALVATHVGACNKRERRFRHGDAGRTIPDQSLIWKTSSKSSLNTSFE